MKDNVSECHINNYKEIVIPYVDNKGFSEWNDFRMDIVCSIK